MVLKASYAQMNELPIPRSVDEISPKWLTAALDSTCHGRTSEITDIKVERIGLGAAESFMGTLARLYPVYSEQRSGRPKSLIVKLPDPDPVRRREQSRVFEAECGFYNSFSEHSYDNLAKLYYVASETGTCDHIIRLEDLACGRPASLVDDHSPSDVRRVFDALFTIHSKWWNSPLLDTCAWAWDGRSVEEWEQRQEQYSKHWEDFASNWAQFLPDGVTEIAEALTSRMVDTLCVAPDAAVTLTHGDARPENLFFFDNHPNRDVVLIDWQRVEMRPAAWDLANFVLFSMSVDDRRSSEHALLSDYYANLVSEGDIDYSIEQLHSDYRLGLLTPLIRAIPATSVVDPRWPGAAEMAGKALSRFAALTDWKCGELF